MSDLELITPAEFARLRRCSLRTLDRERATGTGCPHVRLGARVLYRRADIERYIEEHVRGHESKDAALTSQHPNQRPKVRVRGDHSPGEV
jgi:hypothetical protein